MANRKAFQEWLNRFPEDTEIKVMVLAKNGEPDFQRMELVDEDLWHWWDFYDFPNERMLHLGSECPVPKNTKVMEVDGFDDGIRKIKPKPWKPSQ